LGWQRWRWGEPGRERRVGRETSGARDEWGERRVGRRALSPDVPEASGLSPRFWLGAQPAALAGAPPCMTNMSHISSAKSILLSLGSQIYWVRQTRTVSTPRGSTAQAPSPLCDLGYHYSPPVPARHVMGPRSRWPAGSGEVWALRDRPGRSGSSSQQLRVTLEVGLGLTYALASEQPCEGPT
jgi:hypothetical protein